MSDEPKGGDQPVSVDDVATVVVKLSRRVKRLERKVKRVTGGETDVIGFRLEQDEDTGFEEVPEELRKKKP